MQGGKEMVDVDVNGIRGLIGVKYKGDASNRFNVLSKKGRQSLREEVGRILSKGESGGSGGIC
jgi:hypothetical protein